jgi:HK97 family phage major capsid protein
MRAFQDKSRADGSRWGGVQGYWESEAQQHTTTKPTFRALPTRLGKCVVMIHATEEQLEDTTGLEADLSRVAADEIRFQVNRAIFTGTGNGWPLGLTNAGCKITQAAVSGQGVNTVVAQNVDEMWARRADGAGTNYVWLANQEIEPQLAKLNYSVTNTGAVWTYLPGGYMGPGQAAPMPATLKGRQVHYIEQAKALGTEGDLVLWDPTQYVVVTKATGVKQAISTHLRFDYDEVVFKFSFRMDGRPYWDAPLTRYSGTNSLSPIVTLNSTRT